MVRNFVKRILNYPTNKNIGWFRNLKNSWDIARAKTKLNRGYTILHYYERDSQVESMA